MRDSWNCCSHGAIEEVAALQGLVAKYENKTDWF
jgi:hypothetical protein